MIDSWLNTLSTLIAESMWLAPVLALLAGVLTSFTPCSLSSIPLVIGYVGGTGTEPKKAFRLSLVFAAGSAVTFTILGTLASLAGRLVGTSASWWYLALGILMVLMALQTWEIFNFIPSTYLLSKSTRRGYAGALIAGILGGVFSSPCATPVLIALLAIVAGKGSVVWGMLLLLLYSIGHGVLTIFAGTSVGFVRSMTQNEKYGKASQWMKWIMGGVILLMGFICFISRFRRNKLCASAVAAYTADHGKELLSTKEFSANNNFEKVGICLCSQVKLLSMRARHSSCCLVSCSLSLSASALWWPCCKSMFRRNVSSAS